MLKVIASFLISIFYINILFGQFYSVDVTIDDRLLRSDEKHEIPKVSLIDALPYATSNGKNQG